MIQTAAGWGLDVDRGPDWIFVRVHPRNGFDDAPGFAESVWAVLEQHFIYRVVLELDEIALLHSSIIGQLVLLSKRIHSHGGLVRLCGVSETNREVLQLCRLQSALPFYDNRGDAVMGYRPTQPR
ncbi:MAG: STAS domain-containing protein [Pirellulales bacterium]